MKIFGSKKIFLPLILLLLVFTIKTIDALLLKSIWRQFVKNNALENDATDSTQLHQDEVDNGSDDTLQLQQVIGNGGTTDTSQLRQGDVVDENADEPDEHRRSSMSVDGTSLDIVYWNSELGNNHPIIIEFNNEKQIIDYWLHGKPLKVITHGWLGSDEDDRGVFAIKTAYVATENCNVITVDWNRVASNILYPMPAYLTTQVGSVIAKMLENLVNLGFIDPAYIHVIGHSLGAHVSGACGAAFSLGKIGRVTGLDPAGPGFEYVSLRSDSLDSSDAQFVDVIHTAIGTAGYSKAIGHADFYPNEGKPPQPGCLESYMPSAWVKLIGCSHSRAHELYTDSLYHRNSFIAVQCPTWDEYISGECKNNTKSPMGHDADPKARGIFYLETNSTSPYAIMAAS